MSPAWLSEMMSFDTETTGVDPFTARIVTAHAVDVGTAGAAVRGSWLFNPGVEIPAHATAIHGITNEKARHDGTDPRFGLPEVATCFEVTWRRGLPVIIMNASYDLTLLQAELRRHQHKPLELGPVLDPIVIDRAMDPYRKGKRTLTALAQHYEVKQETAHSAAGDAITAARIVWRLVKRFAQLQSFDLDAMQALQRDAHYQWAEQFEAYLRGQGKNETISREWPVRQLPETNQSLQGVAQ